MTWRTRDFVTRTVDQEQVMKGLVINDASECSSSCWLSRESLMPESR